MKWTLTDAHGLKDVLIALSKGREVYALEGHENGGFKLSRAEKWLTGFHTLGTYRQTEPLKTLFFPAREFIGRWKGDPVREPMRERIIFGVKNCDLSSLAIFDFVFLHGLAKDPYYAEARDKTILVSTDCSDQLDVCFCTAVGEQPYAEKGYDINIAQTLAGYVIEDGSARGAKLLSTVEHLLEEAGPLLLETLEAQRAGRRQELTDHCLSHGLKPGTDYVDRPPGWGREQQEHYTNVHYHQPSDEYNDSWDFSGLIEDALLGYWTGLAISNADEMPAWNPGDEFEAARLKAISELGE